MVAIPSIETEQLVLRPLVDTDAIVLQRINQTEGVLRYFPNPVPPSLERVQRFIAGELIGWEKYGYANWGVLPKGESEIAGWAGLEYLPETQETEVGFLLDKPFWGRGFATEAARAALSFGFERRGLQQVIALVHPDNLASQRGIAKCGMRFIDRKTYFGIELMRFRLERPADLQAAFPGS
jgi:[ribosomal protein S5]-alanine N-acetyltransferase